MVNPTSGTRKKEKVVKEISRLLEEAGVDFDIAFTKGPYHATELAKEAAELGRDAVLAVGGDGTVNETATGLLHTRTALGIVPMGSGNGLARHLKIPMNASGAIHCLLQSEVIKMDVCTANDHPFLNVAGVGYDAVVAHDFASRPTRGFRTYVRTVFDQWFKHKPKKYKLELEQGNFRKKALMISVANGTQFGNNAFIAPDARFDDGLMDVCILYKFPATAVPILAFQLFNKSINASKYTEVLQTSELTIHQKSKKIHLDGEPYKLGKNIHFKVLPHALNIFAPQKFTDAFGPKHPLHRPR